MWKDPIVEEVRKNRLVIEKESKNDFTLLFAKANEKFQKVSVMRKKITKKS